MPNTKEVSNLTAPPHPRQTLILIRDDSGKLKDREYTEFILQIGNWRSLDLDLLKTDLV